MLSPTRRTFLKAATGALAVAPLRLRAELPVNVTNSPLGDNLYLLSGAGCNIVVRTGADGVVMVDGGLAQNAAALAQAVAALPNSGPVRTLFNTHWHPEQTGSNQDLGMAGATIIAQENTRLWLQQNITWPWNGQKFKKLPKIAQPNKTFYDQGALDSGVRYGYISDAAHTDGDLYVYFPKQNILGGGRRRLRAKAGLLWIGGPEAGLAALSADCSACKPSPTKTLRSFPRRARCSALPTSPRSSTCTARSTTSLNQMMNKGHSPSEAVAAKPAKEYEAKMGNPDEFIRRSFESLWAYLSPDA